MAYDYTWLQTAIINWTHRSDLAAQIPDFVMLAEKRISGDLNARLQTMPATLTTVPGAATVTLPDGLNGIRALSIPTYGKIDYMTPELFDRRYLGQPNGVPMNYTIVGNQIRLGPTPDGVYQIDCVYRADIPALADSVDGTNWLILWHPEIYLAAAMCAALDFLVDDERLPRWEGKYQQAVQALNGNDWNSSTTMAVRADTYTP